MTPSQRCRKRRESRGLNHTRCTVTIEDGRSVAFISWPQFVRVTSVTKLGIPSDPHPPSRTVLCSMRVQAGVAKAARVICIRVRYAQEEIPRDAACFTDSDVSGRAWRGEREGGRAPLVFLMDVGLLCAHTRSLASSSYIFSFSAFWGGFRCIRCTGVDSDLERAHWTWQAPDLASV